MHMAPIESMAAILVGFIVYKESITPVSGEGILLIRAAVVILNSKLKEPEESELAL